MSATAFPPDAGFSHAATRRVAHVKRRVRPVNGSHVDFAYEAEKERTRLSRLQTVRGMRGTITRLIDSTQPWIVTIVTGILVGLLAAYLDLLAAWLSDLRTGICPARPYLSRTVCCTGLSPGETCYAWQTWPEVFGNLNGGVRAFLSYLIYLVGAVFLATTAAFFVQVYAPYAYHTGIPEIKVILGGLMIRGYLGGWTLLVKAVGLTLAVASGLSLGKEGPMVHVACCVGNLVSDLFRVFRENESRKRDVLSAAAAAGLSVAFGAPLGGVLFSLEEASSFFPGPVLWHSFVMAIVAAVTLQYLDPLGTGRLVLFEVNATTEWRGFELLPWLLLGACGGLFGHYFIRANAEYARFRANSMMSDFPITEVAGLAFVTALASYLLPLTRAPTSELVSALFTDCTGGAADQWGLCDADSSFSIIFLLLVTAIAKTAFTIATFGARIPAGVFLPSTAIGACLGRAVGVLMAAWQRAYPGFFIFSGCHPDTPCIAPALYAVVGAASTLGGVTKMTLSLVVVIFELTGAVSLVVQVMLAVLVSKFVGDFLSRDGIYEVWINLRRYTFVNPKVDFRRDDLTGRECMTTIDELVVLEADVATLSSLESILGEYPFKGFPIVQSGVEPVLLGYIARPELEHALRSAKRRGDTTDDTPIEFRDTNAAAGSAISIGSYIDHTPLTLSEAMPMEVVVQMFQRLGTRYIVFTKHGRLAGLMTKTDIHHLLRTDGSHSARADLVTGARSRRRRSSSASFSGPSSSYKPSSLGNGFVNGAVEDEAGDGDYGGVAALDDVPVKPSGAPDL